MKTETRNYLIIGAITSAIAAASLIYPFSADRYKQDTPRCAETDSYNFIRQVSDSFSRRSKQTSPRPPSSTAPDAPAETR